MATKVFPTQNDVAPTTGDGKTLYEANLSAWLDNLLRTNLVVVGLAASAGAGLTLNLAAGDAVIGGFWVKKDAAETLGMTDAATNHVYLKLTRDGANNVTGAVFEANTTGTAPTDSLKIAKVVTSGGSISGVTDQRQLVAIALRDSDGALKFYDPTADAVTEPAKKAEAVAKTGDTMTGKLTISGEAVRPIKSGIAGTDPLSSWPTGISYMQLAGDAGWPSSFGVVLTVHESAARNFQLFHNKNTNELYIRHQNDGTSAWSSWAKFWNQDTDGAGSGLDADKVDGYEPNTLAAASTLALRDTGGRMKAATPSASDDVANKSYADGIAAALAIALG